MHNGAVGGEEARGLAWGFEPLHAPFPLAGGLVRVFGAIVQIAVLPMLHALRGAPGVSAPRIMRT